MRRSSAAIVSALAALAAAAVSPALGQIEECGGANVEMTACVWEQYEAADAELNEVWRQALDSLEGSAELMPAKAAADWRAGLVKAQRAWAEFKDADCNVAVAHEWYGGTGANAAVGACLYEHTQARIEQLRQRYLAK